MQLNHSFWSWCLKCSNATETLNVLVALLNGQVERQPGRPWPLLQSNETRHTHVGICCAELESQRSPLSTMTYRTRAFQETLLTPTYFQVVRYRMKGWHLNHGPCKQESFFKNMKSQRRIHHWNFPGWFSKSEITSAASGRPALCKRCGIY